MDSMSLIGMCAEWPSTTAYEPQGYITPGTVSSSTVTNKFDKYWEYLSRTGSFSTLQLQS